VASRYPTTGAESARVTLVRDLIAGSFDTPTGQSRQVSAIREGTQVGLSLGVEITDGQAIRSDRGVASLALNGGGTVSLGEGSQLRIGSPLVHRIGTIFYESEGALELLASGLLLRLESGSVRVRTNSQGQGRLEVVSGQVLVGAGGLVVGAGLGLELGNPDNPDPTALGMATQEELALWRAERFLPGEALSVSSTGRFALILGGGMANLLSADWVAAQITSRIRLGGEAWLEFGAGATVRPGETDEGGAAYWSVPIRAGARWVRPLPDNPVYFGLGASAELLIFPGCFEDGLCTEEVTVRPGVVGSGLVGVRVHPKLAFEVELSGGVVGFAPLGSTSDLPVVLPQFGLSAAIAFRL
jgi:hypothetical protein